MDQRAIAKAVTIIRHGGIIAYPTESVYGLGCDPQNLVAVERLLAVKQRPSSKGLILIAAEFSQFFAYLQPVDDDIMRRIAQTWPGPVTWVMPAKPEISSLLCGNHESLAVRVTAHPLAAELCRQVDTPLVSTSANHTDQAPCRNAEAVREVFGDELDYVMQGTIGDLHGPTEIRDAISGTILRTSP